MLINYRKGEEAKWKAEEGNQFMPLGFECFQVFAIFLAMLLTRGGVDLP
jgi:hypothetical protein